MSELEQTFGSDLVSKISAAYEAALLAVSDGDQWRLPDRSLRLAITQTLLSLARSGERDPGRLTAAALNAVSRSQSPLRRA